MMIFNEDYFLPEDRNGFHIRSMIKRAWACQLDMLEQVDAICNRHGIHYFLDSGTLLGAVREKGYIAWDDDLDIGMLRKDYEIFREYAMKELPEEYCLENGRDTSAGLNTEDVVVHLRNSRVMRTDPEYLKFRHGCPYVLCIDIFVYDNIPDDPNTKEIFLALYKNTFTVAANTGSSGMLSDCSEGTREVLAQLAELTGFNFVHDKPVRSQLFILLDYLAAMYYQEKNEKVGILGYVQKDEKYAFDRSWFDEVIYMNFEGLLVPVPEGYHYILEKWYGDYMTPVQGKGAEHNYPYFGSQERMLIEEYKKRGEEVPADILG